MITTINAEFESWMDARNHWIETQGRTATYFDLPCVPFHLLDTPAAYHANNQFDHLFPPLQILGSFDRIQENGDPLFKIADTKILLISLEPLKRLENNDFFNQYSFFFEDVPPGFDENSVGYGNHSVNQENYLNYQINYFHEFPMIFGFNSPHALGSNKYWRYIDCLANGFLGNNHLTSANWDSLANAIVDMPIIPLSSSNHRRFHFNDQIIQLINQKLAVLRPEKILVLGNGIHQNVEDLFQLTADHFVNPIQNGQHEVRVSQKELIQGINTRIYFRRFFSQGGGSYQDAYDLGLAISNVLV